MLGERLMPELVKLLDGPAVSYGKGAIVGVAGEMEHGDACVHPMLGKPMRAAIGGGKAVIGSNVKVAAQKTRAMDRMTAPLRKQTADRRTARDHVAAARLGTRISLRIGSRIFASNCAVYDRGRR